MEGITEVRDDAYYHRKLEAENADLRKRLSDGVRELADLRDIARAFREHVVMMPQNSHSAPLLKMIDTLLAQKPN